MKKYLPWISIITYIVIVFAGLCLAIFGFDLLFCIIMSAVVSVAPLIGEIIGVILRAKKGFRYSDCIAVAIADAIVLIPTIIFIVTDMNSTGWFAGLAGLLALLFIVPAIAVSVIVDIVVVIVRRKKLKAE